MINAHCRTWCMARILKIMENEKHTQLDMKNGDKHSITENHGKWETHIVGPGILQENSKTWKMWHKHSLTWNMAKKKKKKKNQHWKTWKMRNRHCRTWYMTKNTEKLEKLEMHIVGRGNMARKLKNVENITQTLFDQDYG